MVCLVSAQALLVAVSGKAAVAPLEDYPRYVSYPNTMRYASFSGFSIFEKLAPLGTFFGAILDLCARIWSYHSSLIASDLTDTGMRTDSISPIYPYYWSLYFHR